MTEAPVILVVDDEPAMLTVLAAVLRPRGFDVQTAAGCEQAIQVCREQQGRLDLALVDRRMPGVDGLKTIAVLRLLAPRLRCCLMGGDVEEYTQQELAALGVTRVFAKPFAVSELVPALRQLVGSPPAECA